MYKTRLKVTPAAEGSTNLHIAARDTVSYIAPPPINVTCSVERLIQPLTNFTPSEMLEAIRNNQHVNMWAIGDQAPIHFNGTVGQLTLDYSTYVKLIGMNHNMSVQTSGRPNAFFKTPYSADGKQLAFCDSYYGKKVSQGIDALVMNPENYQGTKLTNTNVNGWNGSFTNKVTIPQFNSAIEIDWRHVIYGPLVYTDNVGNLSSNSASAVTGIWVSSLLYLAEKEVYGTINYANTTEGRYQQQFVLYANGFDKLHYQHSSPNTAVNVSLRSPYTKSNAVFVSINPDGTVGNSNSSNYGRGASPVFALF